MARLKVKFFTNTKQASENKRISSEQLEDRLKAFANFIIDRILEEQNKAKLLSGYSDE